MSALRTRAPGKVNLSLALGPVRPDRRHELVTVVQAISLADEVRLESGGAEDEVVCPGVAGENLAATALGAYRQATGWTAPPVRVTIEKRVPVAAGMGGGSSDAAATLRLAAAAHDALDQRPSRAAASAAPADLFALAAGLGSDVPALLEPGLVLASGAGERVRRLDPLAPFGVLVLPSPQRLSTADVYREADRLGLSRSASDLDEWRAALAAPQLMNTLFNDLEPAARSLCPAIDAALADARAAGARVAMVSGSGPAVFGLFPGEVHAQEAADALRDRHPGARAASPVGPEAGRVEAA